MTDGKANKDAAALSRLGAAKGGRARAAKMTPEERSNAARRAVVTRWERAGKLTDVAVAIYGAEDRPLRIGEICIPAYVLADGRRVLAQRGLQSGIGLSEGGGKRGARRLAELMDHLESKGIDTKGLTARANSPIRFIPPHGGNTADGYEATVLPDICAVLIEAGRRGVLGVRLEHLATQAALLQHGFATIGIIALVDEVTGYQDYRARDALAKIIERFVAKELRPWVPTFQPEFYKQIHRLNGWEYREGKGNPGVVGHWTTNIVHKRLAPGVWAELKRKTPRLENGRLKHRMFQWLTDDVGHPKLREHLAGVVMLMKYSPNWRVFMDRLNVEYPIYGDQLSLFPENYEPPTISDEAQVMPLIPPTTSAA